MSGISIPISGDLDGFQASIQELTADIRKLTGTINSTFKPAAAAGDQATKSTQKLGQAAQKSRKSFVGWSKDITGIGANLAEMGAGVMQIRRLRGAASGVGKAFRAIRKSPALKKIAIAAVGAAAAIGGIVVAFKTVKAGFRGLLGVGKRVFRGLKSAAGAAVRGIKGVFGGLKRLLIGGGPIGKLLRLAGVAGGLTLLTTQLKGAFDTARGFEDLQVRMEQFTGSASEAERLMKNLTEFSTATPFETKDLLEAAEALQSAGIRDNVEGITKDLAGVSKSGGDLKEMADALAKGFTLGKFQTEGLQKFMNRGINLMPELEAVTGKTGDALRKAIEKGLDFKLVTEAIGRLTQEGGQFFGLLERQSRTTTGLISTLKSAWDEFRRAFMQPILDAVKPVLDAAIQKVNALRERAAAFGREMRDAMAAMFVLARDGRTMELLSSGFRVAVSGAMDLLMRGLRSAVAFFATALPPVFDMALAKFKDPAFWQGLGEIFQGLGHQITSAIKTAFGNEKGAEMHRKLGEKFVELGGERITGAGEGHDVAEVLGKSFTEGFAAAVKAGTGPSSKGYRDALANFRELMRSVSKTVDELLGDAGIKPPSGGGGGDTGGGDDDDEEERKRVGRASFIRGRLARVGGGGFGAMIVPALDPVVREQKQTNRRLDKTNKNLQAVNTSVREAGGRRDYGFA